MASENIDDNPVVAALLSHELPPQSPAQQQAEKEWRPRAAKLLERNVKTLEGPLNELDAHLTLRSYMSGHSLSKCDLLVWGALRQNPVASGTVKTGIRVNLSRWYNFIHDAHPWVAETAAGASVAAKKSAGAPAGGSGSGGAATAGAAAAKDADPFDIGLPDVEAGVVTRFPPEPSGYLHVGHAKAALLNDYFAHQRYPGGKLILRFDDTNPAKEKQEFQDSIVEDLALMGIRPDQTTHTSDYFQQLYEYCVRMLREGLAYADDTEQEVMRQQRMDGIASKHRDDAPADNLARLEEMKAGTAEGTRWCIRAKISVDDTNKAMRDPVIYRCNPTEHHRTGSQWKIYPTYDFCCPVVDSLQSEGITHALRSNEYNDRDAQFQWFIRALKLRPVHNWNFSRLNFVRTVLSKRKLTRIVDRGAVSGWDDARMPTVRGVRRRGMTVAGLREFIIAQGPSRHIVLADWTSFWATNKKHIDPTAARYTALASADIVEATVAGARASPHAEERELHAKYELGTKRVWYSGRILLEQEDARGLEEGEEVTLMNWGNAIVKKLSKSINPLKLGTVTGVELELHLQGDVKKTKKKLTWLSKDQELIPVELVEYDHLLTKDVLDEDDTLEDFLTPASEARTAAVADCNVAGLGADAVMQFDRKGYFRCDRAFAHGRAAVFINIPSGKTGSAK